MHSTLNYKNLSGGSGSWQLIEFSSQGEIVSLSSHHKKDKLGYHQMILNSSRYFCRPVQDFIASTNNSLIPFSRVTSSLDSFTFSSTLSTLSRSSFGLQCFTS